MHRPGALRLLAIAFLVALLVAPAMILLHEVGHYSAAFLLGFEDLEPISYNGVGFGTVPAGLPEWTKGVVEMAGSVVSLVLACSGVVIARLGGATSLALALPTIDCLRTAAGLSSRVYSAGTSLVSVFRAGVRSEFASVGWWLEQPIMAVALGMVGLVIPFVALALTYHALKERGSCTIRFGLLGSTLGGIAGATLWLSLLGPLVLP
jgi:hypothetical protein